MKKRILLVDDDYSIRRLLFRVLTGERYQVLSAANGEEAMELANGNRVDLMLLDLKLAGQSGWDTFKQLTTQNPFLPVVIITARPNQLFRAAASGAAALMEKPLDLPKLLRTIHDLLSEPPEIRRARLSGQAAEFRYLPPTPQERGAGPSAGAARDSHWVD